MDALLLVDKPEGPTSHDVVARFRRLLKEKRIGHAGTLDPPASGLLVLAVGRAARLLRYLEGHDKEYRFRARFGRVTDTDDASGRVLRESDPGHLDRAAVERALERFRGEIRQVPPRYSAIKVKGEPLHKAARRGEDVATPPRTVRVHELELLDWSPPSADFRALCSKGTYVRAIVRDLGEALGVGASVEGLRRTASGPFRVGDAVSIDVPREEAEAAALPPDAGLHALPEVRLSTDQALRFTQGQKLDRGAPAGLVRVYVGPRFLGVGEADGASLRPRTVLA